MQDKNDNYSIIPHAHAPLVLLLKAEQEWTLPRHSANAALKINQAMHEQFGLVTTVLHCVYDRYKDDEQDDTHRVYALENHSPTWLPPKNARWLRRADIETLALCIPEHRTVLEAWFDEREQGIASSLRLPWMYIGWFDSVSLWLAEQLPLTGYRANGPLEQVSVSIWSSVLRVPTTDGYLYFKASAPVFAYEPVLTQTLARLFPTHMPSVLAVDQGRHWMLMRDAGTTLASLDETEADVEDWETMLRTYARMQIEASKHIDVLIADGIPDRRLKALPALFEEVLNATPLLLVGQENGLPAEELQQLLDFVPEFNTLCKQLASFNIPETLHHDDFHGGNVLFDGKNYVFFDWAECALAHPFYSMVILQRYAKYVLEYDEATLARLRDAYLKPWTAYASMERLRAAFALAQRLGTFCRALTWYRLIAHVEPKARPEYEGSLPYWLRLFLGTVE